MPSVSFLPGLFVHKLDSSLSDHLAEIQGLLCPEGLGEGGLEGGLGGTFTLERISSPDSCQGKAGPSIEQNSSCVRADHANSIERDPSAQPPANKVIFPNLLRQKVDTLPVLVLSMSHRQDPDQSWVRLAELSQTQNLEFTQLSRCHVGQSWFRRQ